MEIENNLSSIYADSSVTPDEIIQLRDEVDRATQRILREEGLESSTHALFQSFDVTNQLLQDTLLRFKGEDYSDTAREMIASAIEAHGSLLQANVDAFGR
jgi:hypothetical protein